MRAFWDIAPCGLGVNRRFRGEYCLHDQGHLSTPRLIYKIAVVKTWRHSTKRTDYCAPRYTGLSVHLPFPLASKYFLQHPDLIRHKQSAECQLQQSEWDNKLHTHVLYILILVVCPQCQYREFREMFTLSISLYCLKALWKHDHSKRIFEYHRAKLWLSLSPTS